MPSKQASRSEPTRQQVSPPCANVDKLADARINMSTHGHMIM